MRHEGTLSSDPLVVLLMDVNTKERAKAAALLKVYLKLQNNKLKTIYSDPNRQSQAKAEFKNITDSALRDPLLMSERNCLIYLRTALINLSFILVVPFVVNWCKNKSVLYHHKTKSEELIENTATQLKNKMGQVNQ